MDVKGISQALRVGSPRAKFLALAIFPVGKKVDQGKHPKCPANMGEQPLVQSVRFVIGMSAQPIGSAIGHPWDVGWLDANPELGKLLALKGDACIHSRHFAPLAPAENCAGRIGLNLEGDASWKPRDGTLHSPGGGSGSSVSDVSLRLLLVLLLGSREDFPVAQVEGGPPTPVAGIGLQGVNVVSLGPERTGGRVLDGLQASQQEGSEARCLSHRGSPTLVLVPCPQALGVLVDCPPSLLHHLLGKSMQPNV